MQTLPRTKYLDPTSIISVAECGLRKERILLFIFNAEFVHGLPGEELLI
jgi:hypothetical protein